MFASLHALWLPPKILWMVFLRDFAVVYRNLGGEPCQCFCFMQFCAAHCKPYPSWCNFNYSILMVTLHQAYRLVSVSWCLFSWRHNLNGLMASHLEVRLWNTKSGDGVMFRSCLLQHLAFTLKTDDHHSSYWGWPLSASERYSYQGVRIVAAPAAYWAASSQNLDRFLRSDGHICWHLLWHLST